MRNSEMVRNMTSCSIDTLLKKTQVYKFNYLNPVKLRLEHM